ncbi:rhamnogalacturonan acetylesterase [Paenibacillus hamazuiensis]|uniref:rhamnogalacturonan acetylesterase n=1 Tax=Paenibacillus hamazuiensis TaxID=2936508 RepID=UPI00200C0AF3|nr:rhamnogalacturonan acetylesterase [Paenibacillus hamazuiensis]
MKRIKLFIAGDSTAADYPDNEYPMAGWGQMLPHFLTDKVEVVDKAACGRSSKSFIAEGRLAEIDGLIGEGDYLFIQFGHNDQKPDERFTDPATTYPAYMTQYVEVARIRGAQPVLLSSVERRHFDEAGNLQHTHGDYPEAARKLAAKLGVPFIDLRIRTRELYTALGPEKSKKLFVWLEPGEHPNYPDGASDNTHFNVEGAWEVARLAAEEIAGSDLPLRQFVRDPDEVKRPHAQ